MKQGGGRDQLAAIQLGVIIAAIGGFLMVRGAIDEDQWAVKGAVIALVGLVIYVFAKRNP